MFKLALNISSLLFLVLSMSGCSGCGNSEPAPTKKSSTSNASQKNPNNSDPYVKPGSDDPGMPNSSNKGNKTGPKFNHNPDPREFVDAQTGLCDAIYQKNETNIVYFLKRNGGRIDGDCLNYTVTDGSGAKHTGTPFTMAGATGTSHIFEILIENSTATAGDALPWRFKGNTYLHFAVSIESEKATEILARRSPLFMDIKNWDGLTALVAAITKTNALRLVEILLENNANPNMKSSLNGVEFYPADLAASLNKYDVFDLLKKYGGKSSAFGGSNPTKANLIENCFADFLSDATELKKQHSAMKAQIENSHQCPYGVFETVLAGDKKLSDVGCKLSDSLKKDYEKFSAEFHRSLRSNAIKFSTDHCRNQTNADAGVCNETQTRFNACMGIAKKGKNIDAI